MEDIKLEKYTEWLYDRYCSRLPKGCRAEDCYILEDLADVLIMMKETNNGHLDDLFGLPIRREARCDMRCRK